MSKPILNAFGVLRAKIARVLEFVDADVYDAIRTAQARALRAVPAPRTRGLIDHDSGTTVVRFVWLDSQPGLQHGAEFIEYIPDGAS